MKKLFILAKKIFNRRTISTFIAWAFFISLVGWVWVALGWWLLGKLWWHELVVPRSVLSTVQAMLLITVWSSMVLGFFIFWARYNYKRYFIKDKRQYRPLETQSPALNWQERVFDPSIRHQPSA